MTLFAEIFVDESFVVSLVSLNRLCTYAILFLFNNDKRNKYGFNCAIITYERERDSK